MQLSRNAYYHWLATKDKPQALTTKMKLKTAIRRIFKSSKQIYGSARITKMLQREGLIYSRAYIAKLMKEMKLKSVLRKKFVATTNSCHSLAIADNQLNRNFKSLELGKKWVSDITYIRVGNDWNYLTTIIDLADRKVVGWSLSQTMTANDTVKAAWLNARNNREIKQGFVFHSDRGIQYCCKTMTNLFVSNKKITQSMSRKANCWDNAVAESFFKTIKHEWLYRFKFYSHLQLKKSINQYIIWYNTKRLHSSLDYLTPLEMELKLKNLNYKITA